MNTMPRNIYEMKMEKYVPEKPYCVMLDTSNPLLYPEFIKMPVFTEAQHHFPDKAYGGIVDDYHVTLRYGILPQVSEADINEVLSRWMLSNPLELAGHYEVFGTGDYDAVVAPIDMSNNSLLAINYELGCLPNVTTFPVFRPHVTIGYFQRGFWDSLDARLRPPLNYNVQPGKFTITGGHNY